ncbi:hypothetical protein H9Q72_012230 [Fusarium xylarioides]|uniref:Uncharacterized protein n=1 Tax=Fusarium xylarioides TaxID=221167 RepID=A0A9P7L3D1_9HYPO|nr:hypothetical protein H9Q72_012230 [Fusarium xylarioides]
MANDNDKKKTEKVPKPKGKDKDDSKQLTRRAGPQSGQHNSSARDASVGGVMEIRPRNSLALTTSRNAIGQQQVGLTDGRTGQLAVNEMCVTTGFGGKTELGFSTDSRAGAYEVVDAITSAQKPGEIVVGHLALTNVKDFIDKNFKRKRLVLDYDEDAELEARRSARRARDAAIRQLANQRESGQGSGQDQGRTDDNSQRRIRCVGCKSDKHTLAECLKAGADGYMRGCPFCDTMDHSAGNCPHPAFKNDKLLRVRHFVYYRRNMPSFLNTKAWYPLIKANVPQRELSGHSRFPWTPEFTKSMAGRIGQIQSEVDVKGLDKAYLPVDPSVKGWSAAVAYHQSLEKDEKEKALAEARAKVTPLSDVQKAAAAFLGSSLVPDTEPTVPEEEDVDMAGNAQVASPPLPKEQSAAPEDVSEYLAHAKKQHDASQCRPWDDISSDGNSDDDDDDEEDYALKKLKQGQARLEAAKKTIRAKSHASVL